MGGPCLQRHEFTVIMRKIFTKSIFLTLSLLIVVGVFVMPNNASAAVEKGTCTWTATSKTDPTKVREVRVDNTLKTGCVDQDTPTEKWVFKSFNGTGTQEQDATIDNVNNSAWWILSIITPFLEMVSQTLLAFAALITTVTGYLLNGVIFHTVVKVSDNYGNLTAILESWKALRDIANMCFIFVLLYAAIQTILGQKGDNQRLIVNVIVVAALLNFSLFFTRVVIDMGNALALTFYDAINPGIASKGFELGQAGLSNAFMQSLHLNQLYSPENTLGGSGVIMAGLMGTILLLITSFCFLAVAILFIIRYILLIFVMIFSPVAMVASILPKGTGIGKYQDQWLDVLLGQTFFAPIYFLLTWVSLRVMNGVMGVLNSATTAGTTTGNLSGIGVSQTLNSGAFMMFINFAVVIALVITSLIMAAQWADKGGTGASKWAKEKAGGLAFGTAGKIGRGTIGRIGQQMADSEWLKKKGANSVAARLTLAAGRKTAGASFDARNVGSLSSLSAGKGKTGGFAKDMKNRIDNEKKVADSLKPSDLAVIRAENELDEAKNLKLPEDNELEKMRKVERDRLSNEINRQRNRVNNERDPERRAALAAKLNETGARYRKTENITDYKDLFEEDRKELERKAKENVYNLKGIDDNEAKKLALEDYNKAHPDDKKTEDQFNKFIKQDSPESKAAKAMVESRKQDSAGDARKKTYATNLANSLTFGKKFSFLQRVGIVGETKQEYLLAAAEIRKSMKSKSNKDKIFEAVQAAAKDAEEDAPAAPAAPATPASPAAPQTPPTNS